MDLAWVGASNTGKTKKRQAVIFWGNEMPEMGYKMVMTSTQADEEAQHFYRKLEYIDKGCIFSDIVV